MAGGVTAVQQRAVRLSFAVPLLLIVLGVFITPHYGESWDELKFYKYADEALKAYVTWPTDGTIHLTGNTYDNYGPVYVMAVALGARGLGLLVPWSESDLRHLLYFLTFLGGVWAFLQLARRWLSHAAVLGATALFATQPLFWGHAFISPKDIPFLTFFLLTVHFGLQYFDRAEPISPRYLPVLSRRWILWMTAAWLVSVLVLFGGTALLYEWLDAAVHAAAAGRENLIARIASDVRTADPLIYVQKYFLWFIWARAIFFLLFTGGLLVLYRRHWPSLPRMGRSILLPAALLGLTVCIRVLGPLAGLLVALYGLHKHGRRALPALGVYGLLALAAMYATWPYLWPDPAGHFVESILVMAKYPWQGQVLFDGTLYASTDIPRSYLPVLLGVQLTELVWPLFAVGLVLTVIAALKKHLDAVQLLTLALIWFILPALGFSLLRSPLYDNFRQIFFILPPVFLIAGVVFDRIKIAGWRNAFMLICVLPGVIAGVRLHPYEYIYYNRFIGGEAGALRRFELDYWGTSYREAARWLNENAAPNAPIWADGPSHLLGMYLRPDLKLYSSYEAERADHYDYVVSTSRYNLDLTSYPEARVLQTIARDGAVLAVIKQP